MIHLNSALYIQTVYVYASVFFEFPQVETQGKTNPLLESPKVCVFKRLNMMENTINNRNMCTQPRLIYAATFRLFASYTKRAANKSADFFFVCFQS